MNRVEKILKAYDEMIANRPKNVINKDFDVYLDSKAFLKKHLEEMYEQGIEDEEDRISTIQIKDR